MYNSELADETSFQTLRCTCRHTWCSDDKCSTLLYETPSSVAVYSPSDALCGQDWGITLKPDHSLMTCVTTQLCYKIDDLSIKTEPGVRGEAKDARRSQAWRYTAPLMLSAAKIEVPLWNPTTHWWLAWQLTYVARSMTYFLTTLAHWIY